MRKVSIAVLAFLIFSCNGSNYVPKDIIQPGQMQNILWDMIRGDILAQEMAKRDSTQTIKSESFAITEKIFVIHHTDRAAFKKSLAFYEQHPALIKTIFDSLNAIQTRKSTLESEKKLKPYKDYHLIQGNKAP